MNAVFENIYKRRSVRSYTDEKVDDKTIDMIIDAGVHAANGINVQGLRFAVVSDRDLIIDYSTRGKALYHKMMVDNGFVNEHLEKMVTNPDLDIFYGAPTVIFVFSTPNTATPQSDAALAVGNMMLAATSLGLGTCWIGLADMLFQDEKFMKDNKVPEDLTYRATMILGHPKKDSGPTPRNPPVIFSRL